MSNRAIFESSLEMVADVAGDPAAPIYHALFTRYPHLEASFARDHDGSIRGHMLMEVLDALADMADEGRYALALFASEVVNHQELGVKPEEFGVFASIVHETMRTLGGTGWTDSMDQVWTSVLEKTAALSTTLR